jgi:hypothetical protein
MPIQVTAKPRHEGSSVSPAVHITQPTEDDAMTEPPTPNHAEPSLDVRHRRARERAPQLADHDLVKIASAYNQVEAEFLQGLLHEQGVPSVLRRSPGFDVPGFLVAGQRDVLVAMSSVELARDALGDTEREPLLRASAAPRRPPRVRAGLLIAAAFVALVVCVVIDLVA